jgi:hypothetical protein
MTIRAITIALGILSMIACVPTSLRRRQPRPYEGSLPSNVHVNLAGTFTLSPTGELTLALDDPCTEASMEAPWEPCDLSMLYAIRVVAQTPWGTQVHGEWLDEEHLVFRVNWKLAVPDPLDADVPAMIARPWTISGTTWTPRADEIRQILTLLGAPSEAEIVSGGPPPSLEVTRFEIDGGALHAGSGTTLTVQITNRGPGTAYRVAATVRSGIWNLHGRRAEFGRIAPGTEKLRRLRLMLPASETSPDTMLVLVVDEGSGFSPPSASRRVPIAAPAVAPVLAVQCSMPGRSKERPGLDAGEQIVVHCLVENTGTGTANVELETSLAGATPIASLTKPVAPKDRTAFDIPMAVPRELAIDSAVEIAVVAVDRHFARSASTRIVGVIRKPRLCAAGQLTHTQYGAKLAKLRAALSAGDLTQDEFDRYDAELVTCLNDAR